MSIPPSALLLTLAWFTAVNLFASAVVAAATRRICPDIAGEPGRARRLLALRFLPAAIAAVVAVLLFAPAHVILEPPNADEQFGWVMIVLAIAGGALVGRSVGRIAGVAAGSVRLAMFVRRMAGRCHANAFDMPLLPGIVLAGVFRPRVLIGARARAVLTPAELDVAVAHEHAHRLACDNVIRVLFACVPDFFALTASARRLERMWEEEAECLADARAVAGCPDRATRLASALVKVARQAVRPRDIPLAPGWSSFYHAALLETRVRLLVGRPAAPACNGRPWMKAAVAVGVALAAAWIARLPHALHVATEALVTVLP